MKIIVRSNARELGSIASDLVLESLFTGQRVFGVATGSSPLPIYRDLAGRVATGEVSLAGVRAFALDEYVGLPAGHPQSYRSFLRQHLVDPCRMDPTELHVPPSSGPDLAAINERAAAYDDAIEEAGGVDVQILGIGSNGHIGFNEPGSPRDSITRVAPLTDRTRRDNARFFDSIHDVPTHCVTQGLDTILRARRIVLVAVGATKAGAVRRAVEGAVDSECPASFLQTHEDVTFLLDPAAASLLTSVPASSQVA